MMSMNGVVSGLLQAHWRGVQAFRSYQGHRAAVVLQKCYRGCLARQALAQQHAAAVCLQTAWRRHSAQMRYAKTLLAVTRLQASFAMYCAPGTIIDTNIMLRGVRMPRQTIRCSMSSHACGIAAS